jgi:hypothetical protein
MIATLQEIFDRFVFDPSLIDLIVWYNYLTWNEFLVSAATVLAWRFVWGCFERFVAFHTRRLAARGLLHLALAVRPRASPFLRRACLGT